MISADELSEKLDKFRDLETKAVGIILEMQQFVGFLRTFDREMTDRLEQQRKRDAPRST